MAERLSKDDVTKNHKGEQSSFSCDLSMLVSYLQLNSSRFDTVLNTCSTNTYQSIGSMYLDLNIHEKTLDAIIELLQKDQLDENINLETLEKSCLQLSVR